MLVGGQRLTHLDLARVLALIFVLFIHSKVSNQLDENLSVRFFKGFIGSGAVPFYFMLSGYLGARKLNSPETTPISYIRDKIRTLLIPFLFWNVFLLFVILVAKFIGADASIKGAGGYFNLDLNFQSMLYSVFGIGRMPLVYQFWFVRDLMVVSILAFFIHRYLPTIPLWPWLCFFIHFNIANSLALFYLGYQMHGLLPYTRVIAPLSACLYSVIWIFIGLLKVYSNIDIPSPLLELGSVAFIYFLSCSLIPFRLFQRLSLLGGSTFMIYALHEPLMSMLVKLWSRSGVPGSDTLMGFFITPFVIFPICWMVYSIVRHYFPSLLPYTTGGR